MNERGNIHIHYIHMQFCCLETSVNIDIASWSCFNTWEGIPLVEYHAQGLKLINSFGG